ncbi:MAG: protein-glutamate O-methyltransferase CheR [Oceanospirillaceae bacterium]|nr:protein-glutamate O-methyltransferase CheR [Oceanospirillaceae bacterium]
MNPFTITRQGFKQFSSYLENSCGIVLAENKEYLVQCRLSKLMGEHALKDLDQLVLAMSRGQGKKLTDQVVDAMTTNETLWFRDTHPYEVLTKRLFPELLVSSSSQMKIWSAACATGQEPYSISMAASEYIESNRGLKGARISITATDISSTALAVAKKGEYELFALGRGLSKQRQDKFFTQVSEDTWGVNSQIKAAIAFKSINLLDSYSMIGKLDVIFCRNVLIYFSSSLKKQILEKMHAQLKPGGYLVLGASESLPGLSDKFEVIHCKPGILYRAV